MCRAGSAHTLSAPSIDGYSTNWSPTRTRKLHTFSPLSYLCTHTQLGPTFPLAGSTVPTRAKHSTQDAPPPNQMHRGTAGSGNPTPNPHVEEQRKGEGLGLNKVSRVMDRVARGPPSGIQHGGLHNKKYTQRYMCRCGRGHTLIACPHTAH